MAPKGGKISLLIGMTAGALTGLFFAPQKGKELRANIAKERQQGGLGHKAIGKDLAKMADEVSNVVKEVAKSDEAKRFWQHTNAAVDEWTQGNVDLDEWVKSAHLKADKLKKAVSQYADERKKYLGEAKNVVKKAKKKVKSAAAKAGQAAGKARKAVKKAKQKAAKVEKKAVSTVSKVKSAAPKVPKKAKKTVKKAVKKVTPKKSTKKKS